MPLKWQAVYRNKQTETLLCVHLNPKEERNSDDRDMNYVTEQTEDSRELIC